MSKEAKLKELVTQVIDLFEGNKEYSHMTGDIELCGKTADEAIIEIEKGRQ